MNSLPHIILKPGRESSLQRFHPWIFSGAIKKEAGLQKGDIVEVYSSDNKYLCTGHYQPESIAVRIFSFRQLVPDYAFWLQKIQSAYALRLSIGLAENAHTNVYRLIHGEGDSLPGLIADYYNGTVVLQCHTVGMYRMKDILCEAIREVLKDKVHAIYNDGF